VIPTVANDIFLLRLALGPTQPSIQWILESLSPGVKQLSYEADCSPPCSAKVKNGGAVLPLPHTFSWHGTYLIKHRNVLPSYYNCLRIFQLFFIYLFNDAFSSLYYVVSHDRLNSE
jgi:hypothetical protein